MDSSEGDVRIFSVHSRSALQTHSKQTRAEIVAPSTSSRRLLLSFFLYFNFQFLNMALSCLPSPNTLIPSPGSAGGNGTSPESAAMRREEASHQRAGSRGEGTTLRFISPPSLHHFLLSELSAAGPSRLLVSPHVTHLSRQTD